MFLIQLDFHYTYYGSILTKVNSLVFYQCKNEKT